MGAMVHEVSDRVLPGLPAQAGRAEMIEELMQLALRVEWGDTTQTRIALTRARTSVAAYANSTVDAGVRAELGALELEMDAIERALSPGSNQ